MKSRSFPILLVLILSSWATAQTVNPGRVNVVTTPWSVNWLTHNADAPALTDLGFTAWEQSWIGSPDPETFRPFLTLGEINVRDNPYLAVGDGVTDDNPAIEDANAVALAAGVGLYFPPGVYHIDDDTTISVPCRFAPGAMIEVAATVALRFEGTVTAPLTQIVDAPFDEAAILISMSAQTPTVYPEWFGAVGDGTTDDVVALRLMFRFAGAMGDYAHHVTLSRTYAHSLPIFLGRYTSSEGGMGSFLWAGETRYWGGAISGAKLGLVIEGRTDLIYGPPFGGLLATYAASAPMIVVTGGRNLTLRHVQLDGDGGATRASEGIFLTGGTWVTAIEDCVIRDCERPLRLGEMHHWATDPVTFRDYLSAGILAVGGYMIEGVCVDNTWLRGNVCATSETAQAINTQYQNARFYCDLAGGYGLHVNAGRSHLFNPYFGGANTDADIFSVAMADGVGSNGLWVYGGHSESAATYYYREAYGFAASYKAAYFHGVDTGWKSLSMVIPHKLTFIGGNVKDIAIYGVDAAPYPSVVFVAGARISGDVGNIRNAACAALTYMTFADCEFTQNGVSDPYAAYWADGHNTIINCAYTGDSFTCDRTPTQLDVFSEVQDAATITDSGDGNPATFTYTPARNWVMMTNPDPDGCNVTMGETGIAAGRTVEIINNGTYNITILDSAGVCELAGSANRVLGSWDSLLLRYTGGRWLERGANN